MCVTCVMLSYRNDGMMHGDAPVMTMIQVHINILNPKPLSPNMPTLSPAQPFCVQVAIPIAALALPLYLQGHSSAAQYIAIICT